MDTAYFRPEVTLRDFSDADAIRNDIYSKVEDSFKTVFPQSYGGVRLEVDNLKWADPPIVSKRKQRDALNEGKFLHRRLRGTLKLYNDETGELLDKDERTLVRAPMYTERGTFIHNGNEYATISQQRLLPGAYVRKKENGLVEAQVNPRQGTGSAFRVHLEPETGLFKLDMRRSTIRLYPFLKGLGISDEELERRWGPELLEMNRAKDDPKVFNNAYMRLVRKANPDATPEEKREALMSLFENSMLNRSTAKTTFPMLLNRSDKGADKGADKEASVRPTLPSGFADYGASDEDVPLGLDGFLQTTEKVLRVSRGEDDPDERDNLTYKKIFPVDELLRERILLDHGKLRLGTMRQLARAKSLKPVRTNHFDPYVHNLIVKSALSAPLEEINPLHLLEQQRRVTGMGEGGLKSEESITVDAQNVMPSQFGFLDVLSGPESGRAGVDTRFAWGTKLGSDGRLYQQFKDPKTGKRVWLSPQDIQDKVVALPS
jgi:DNA-directed RNA polymerase beta subunit